ncbi:MAG: N-acetyl-gamma-glutamyl-phosphate reductase [Spirochaetota bacterium]
MKAAILGTSGYTGMILLRLLSDHPDVACILPVSSSQPGESLLSVDPALSGDHPNRKESVLCKTDATNGRLVSVEEACSMKPDVVFAALPHLASGRLCEPFFKSTLVIDLSADFRIRDPALFKKYYGEEPPRKDLLQKAVYGLSEINRDDIRKADLIANPGCYPTATLLPLIPLIKAGLIRGRIVVNALSGISGAGKKNRPDLRFCERTENAGAYSPGKTHRHSVEIQQEVDRAHKTAGAVDILFTPHLIPVKRGMFVTTVAELTEGIGNSEIEGCFRKQYRDAVFVALRPGRIPETDDVWGSNRCDISWHLEGKTILLFSAIDNLVKGASGQAVQNMNIRLGLKEASGLRVYGEL